MTDDIKDELTRRKRKTEYIGNIYDEAMELQKDVSNLWTLDQNSLQRMEEFQEQLISEIHDLASAEAVNLRTMIQILNINHHTCLLQVSNRTRALVFSEFLRRVMKILEDYK